MNENDLWMAVYSKLLVELVGKEDGTPVNEILADAALVADKAVEYAKGLGRTP